MAFVLLHAVVGVVGGVRSVTKVSDFYVPNDGPQPAKILLIGEAPGKEEEASARPFVGGSGRELTKMLNEAGILRTEVRVANVCHYRPPGNKMDLWWPEKKKDIRSNYHVNVDGEWFDPRVAEGIASLREEIERTQPNVIVPLGNLPLWATTGNSGITKWRSSILRGLASRGISPTTKVIPTIHPAAVLRNWEWRYLAVHDFRRVKRWQDYKEFPTLEENFLVAPTFDQVRDTLTRLLSEVQRQPTYLAVDIETKSRHLACLGIAWSKRDAICIPFYSFEKRCDCWTSEQELEIVLLLRELLTHRHALCIGQNWQYDYQYIAKYWGFEVNLNTDIMSEHHVHFAGLAKGLDFQSSLYADIHVYWKDEGKEMGKGSEVVWWTYNCKDCCRTWEIAEVLRSARRTSSLKRTLHGTPFEIQQRLTTPVARASARGIRVDHDRRAQQVFVLQNEISFIHEWLEKVLGHPFNPRSNPQMSRLFYDDLQQPKILHRKTKKPTLNDEALDIIAKRDILLRPLCHAINHYRSLGNCLAVCTQPLDSDGRFRSQYTIPGTETYRFTSSADPFGFGTNGQNITSGDRADKDWPLPNLRKLFIPDEGFTLGEFDLPQADARVVAWEAEEESLIDLFNDPTRHLHFENAEIIYGERLKDKKDRRYYFAKQGVHLTNYGGNAKVLAMTLGITVAEAERFQKRYFQMRPSIKKWHQRIQMQLMTKRYVENVFGYRRFYFDRIDDLLKEALAWIPQSTVAIATNLGILNITDDTELCKQRVQFLLQVHDSSVFQWPTYLTNWVKPRLHKHLTITVPYASPLVFQAGIKTSTKSWGDCEEEEWEAKAA